MRAAIAAESAGIPSVSILCEGFEQQALATGRGMGFDGLALAVTRGHVDAQDVDTMITNFREVTVDQIVDGLTQTSNATTEGSEEPAAIDVVLSGTIEEINEAFFTHGWSDGSAIIPPTRDRVEAFIAAGGYDPWRSLGIARPSGRDLTIWSIAVNAVMAGCHSDYMPVLIAATEILADPAYGAQHSGNTTGADALMILSGPDAGDLGFNSRVGALREGARANTSVGRWLRLYQRNVLDFTTDANDKATFGNSARVVLTEDYATLADIGWDSMAADFAFASDDNVLSMARMNTGAIIGSVFGSTPEEILPYLGDGLARTVGWDLTHVYGLGHGQQQPLLVLSPILARVFASAGWSKADVREGLFETARIPAWRFEKLIGEWSNLTAGRRTLADLVDKDLIPAVFAQSDDPNRLVPIVDAPEKLMIAVAGDPNRTNAYGLSHDGPHGDWTAKRVDMSQSTDLLCEVPSADG